MLGILICVVLWELLKWGILATSRRARRLARIRAQTYEAIQRELQRFQETQAVDVSESEPAPEQPVQRIRTSRRRRIAEDPQRASASSQTQEGFSINTTTSECRIVKCCSSTYIGLASS